MATSGDVLSRPPSTAGGGNDQEPPREQFFGDADIPGDRPDWRQWGAELRGIDGLEPVGEAGLVFEALKALDNEVDAAMNKKTKERLDAHLEAAKTTEGGRGYVFHEAQGSRSIKTRRNVGAIAGLRAFPRSHVPSGMPSIEPIF